MSTVLAAYEDLRDRLADLWDAIRAVAADDLRRVAGWVHRRGDNLETLAEHVEPPPVAVSFDLEELREKMAEVVRQAMVWSHRHPETIRFAVEVQGWKAKAAALGLDDDVVDVMLERATRYAAEHGTDPMAEARRYWRDLYWRSVRLAPDPSGLQ